MELVKSSAMSEEKQPITTTPLTSQTIDSLSPVCWSRGHTIDVYLTPFLVLALYFTDILIGLCRRDFGFPIEKSGTQLSRICTGGGHQGRLIARSTVRSSARFAQICLLPRH